MNILLVYPEFPDTFWSFKHALKFVRKKAVSPPLGLLTIAAMLPADWNQRLIDLNIQQLTKPDLDWADYVFLSGMEIQSASARHIVDLCVEARVPMVGGGPLFTISHDDFPEIDHFVLNEAEITLPEFLRDLAQGTPKRFYTTTAFPELTQTPVPRWDLVDMARYATMNIQFSRGCPYNCDFCNVTALLGHRPRTKTTRQILAELDSLYALGWRDAVFFVDDNLLGNKRYLKTDLLPALIEWQKDKVGLPLSTEISINLADDPALIEMMYQAGFTTVFIGIETPNEDSLAECSKKQNLNRDLVEDVMRIQRAGIQVQGGFIVGFDNDSPSIFQRQIDFIQNSAIVTAMVGLLQAPPGTKLYERLKLEGRLLDHITGDNVDGTTNIIPKMNLDILQEGYRSILEHIYSPDYYYRRVKTLLQEARPPRISTPLAGENLLAFLRSVYLLGIRGKERLHYWKLLGWTLFRRPRLFPLAVTLAIYGYHFRTIIEIRVL